MRLASVLVALVPVWWVLGLDQLAWVTSGLLLGWYAVAARVAPRPLLLVSGAFLVLAILSGVLSAQGVRWATLARDLSIATAFFATLFGIVALVRTRFTVRWVIVAVTVTLTVSSVLSVTAILLQDPFRFTTPIAPLVPDWIAETVLGATSLVSRSVGTSSYLLGHIFLRPNGLFLFSTSQAVAIAAFLPVMLAAAGTYPGWRRWMLGAAVVNAAGLLATTTRASILGLVFALALVWFIRRWLIGYVRIEIPLNRRSAPVLLGVVAAVVVAAVAVGATKPLVDFLTARSGDSRSTLYEATIDWWTEKPIFGWGTAVDNVATAPASPSAVASPTPPPTPRATPRPTPRPTPAPTPRPLTPQELPPLGSHSQYLGVLFKQGLIGSLLFVAILALMVRYAWRLMRHPRPGSDLVVAAFATSLVTGITEEFWLDPGAALAVGVVWGLVVAAGHAVTSAHEDASAAVLP